MFALHWDSLRWLPKAEHQWQLRAAEELPGHSSWAPWEGAPREVHKWFAVGSEQGGGVGGGNRAWQGCRECSGSCIQQAVPFAVELVRDAEVKCVLKMNKWQGYLGISRGMTVFNVIVHNLISLEALWCTLSTLPPQNQILQGGTCAAFGWEDQTSLGVRVGGCHEKLCSDWKLSCSLSKVMHFPFLFKCFVVLQPLSVDLLWPGKIKQGIKSNKIQNFSKFEIPYLIK